jgi:hypothetical protein
VQGAYGILEENIRVQNRLQSIFYDSIRHFYSGAFMSNKDPGSVNLYTIV